MPLYRILVAFFAVIITAMTPNHTDAAEFRALTNKLVVGRCHMSSCWWFSIEAAEKVGSSPKGELFEIAVKTWEADCKRGYAACGKRTGGDETKSFVFCSKAKPAWIELDNGKWRATLLEPGNSYAIAGVTEGIYAMYWAACHGVRGLAGASKDDDLGNALAKRLGYPFRPNFDEAFNKTQSGLDSADLDSPSDVLKW